MSTLADLRFPDSVALVLGVLDTQLSAVLGRDIPTGNRVPSPRPPEFVCVHRQGGTRKTYVSEEAYLDIEAWSTSVAAAEDIAQAVRSVLFAIAGTTVDSVPIYEVNDAGGPAEVADPLSDQPRHTFSLAIHVRGST
jgi:hypothetical protein